MLLDEMKELKKQYGYSIATISKKSGVPASTVQKVFSGITNPRQDTLEKLSSAFPKPEYNIPPVSNSKESPAKRNSSGLYQGNGNNEYALAEGSGYIGGTSPEKTTGEDVQHTEKKDGEYTIEDYYALPDERRVELIDGVFYDMASPSWLHQTLIAELHYLFASAIKKRKGPCHVALSPLDVQLDRDNKTMVQPDLFIVCDKEMLKNRIRMPGAPDFVLEVLSPSSRGHDMVLKLNKYLNAGVREYWIVDPKKREVLVYNFKEDIDLKVYSFNDTIPVGIYDGNLTIDFSLVLQELIELFGEDF
ncbi:MAG: Uma2 family endonuclease [Lachnospiraceae bacterium]|nr:Uma2 family endonuclease [Lachnospiraceae bacterium]